MLTTNTSPVLEVWQYSATGNAKVTVLPDGCCDLILQADGHGQTRLIQSRLDSTARSLVLPAGLRMTGVRLRPGVMVPDEFAPRMREEISRSSASDPLRFLLDAVSEHAKANDELIDAVSKTSRVSDAARRLGVTARTLHRHMQAKTGKSPSFWFGLARSRRALAALHLDLPLAEIAALAGYADQAHLTRSFQAHFGATPARFRANPRLMRLASHPGFSG